SLFFPAREQHVDAIKISFDGAGVELQGFVKGAASFDDMHLAAQAVPGVLEMRDAEAGPSGRVILVLLDNAIEEAAGSVEIVERPRPRHKGRQNGAGLKVF